MRKTVLVLASVALAMLLVSGVAWAAKVRCERGSTEAHKPCDGTKTPDKMRGTKGRDFIMGFPLGRPRYFWGGRLPRDHDTIYGFAKNDSLIGGAGRDKLYGGSADDYLDGGYGADTIYGSTGNDNIYHAGGPGVDGQDLLYGGTGNDDIHGSNGDRIYGQDGSDHIFPQSNAGKAGIWVSGGAGNDILEIGFAHHTIYGDSGADRVWGASGGDLLRGGDGPDEVSGGGGVDRLYGDEGDDTIFAREALQFEDLDEPDVVSCGSGFDKVSADDEGVDVIAADCEQITYEPPE